MYTHDDQSARRALTLLRIMLIDLYERPYSPEASRSRAFIDKIFSLTGPDGGVVGGEDGISTQRPLKDGGREAWDMIRRLRQKAWQKAGLDPHQLWTEQAQIQAGVRSTQLPRIHDVAEAFSPATAANGRNASSPRPLAGRESLDHPLVPGRQLSEFSTTFQDMTRAHHLSKLPTLQPSDPSRYAYQLPPPIPTSSPGTPGPLHQPVTPKYSPIPPHFNHRQPGEAPPFPSTTTTLLPAAENISPTDYVTNRFTHPAGSSPGRRLLDSPAASPGGHTAGVGGAATRDVLTPPSMVDPNFHFDWDRWDAVFGQHLPVADELMELDPVSGFEFNDFVLGGAGGSPTTVNSGGQRSTGVMNNDFGFGDMDRLGGWNRRG